MLSAPHSPRRWSTLTYRLAMLIAGLLAISAILTTTFAVRSVQDALYSEVSQSMVNVSARSKMPCIQKSHSQ